MRTRLIIFLLFVAAVMACSSTLTEAHAEDTYNFYFQKAPGPTVVNQGGAGPSNPKDIVVNPVSSPAPSAPASVAQATEAIESSPQRNFEFSLGITGSSVSSAARQDFGYSSQLLSGQYVAGLQWNMNSYFALQAEGFYLSGDRGLSNKGGRYDWSGTLNVTPFRIQAGSSIRIALTAIGGYMSVPLADYYSADYYSSKQPGIMHKNSLVYGARMGFEFGNRVAFHATVKRIERFDAPNGTLALAYLF